jgi:hypothetical protein
MTSSVEIRLAGAVDASLIADMSRRTFHDSFAEQNTPEDIAQYMDTQFTREQLMAEVGQPGNNFLLAYVDDQPVGYARLREHDPPPEMGDGAALEIVRIYAEKDAIGKGV